ncbi:tetrapyrrole methylase [Whalleya microplaca]|nr:tetrapyrrole methylase [Whalleya microplaca]
MSTTSTRRKGGLVIAGSGIASVRQLTIEAIQCIKDADMVFYCLSDAATEAYVQSLAKNHFNLLQLYGTNKPRTDTYVQMAEVMLRRVRRGEMVVGIFYGHPGVFVDPSHRAIQIAREEGFKAKMLPGISAEDCLFADLLVDPGTIGCTTYEATDLLGHKRILDPTTHLIVWQVGCVGEAALNFTNKHFLALLDYVEQTYGPQHPVIHYIGAVFPLEEPVMERFTIEKLREPGVMDTIKPSSTFYLPPKALPPRFDGEQFGVANIDYQGDKIRAPKGSPLLMSHPEAEVIPFYGEKARAAIAKLDELEASQSSKTLTSSQVLRDAAIQLAMNHHRLQAMEPKDRWNLINLDGLTQEHKEAIMAGDLRSFEISVRGGEGCGTEAVKSASVIIIILAMQEVDAVN